MHVLRLCTVKSRSERQGENRGICIARTRCRKRKSLCFQFAVVFPSWTSSCSRRASPCFSLHAPADKLSPQQTAHRSLTASQPLHFGLEHYTFRRIDLRRARPLWEVNSSTSFRFSLSIKKRVIGPKNCSD